ncbi:LOW QUALITY PROTEIN: prolyl 3-hydroxylase 2 [Rhinatrema bivittatum]|uniref:LOW QUALITY PROTEIN: prolyl 3-hydroxylase 2 n=1 Tax=Rhinatrema bivittatum TaxID=194408 RepID=UPI00112BCFCA|nr:LOW QUALITY PROTEIN: prolyl 3-hydroxylase 2 [Rhinatrema bivittatum]
MAGRGLAAPLLALLLPLLSLPPALGGPPPPLLPFDALYESGLDAYSRGDFAHGVQYMERALSAHAQLRRTRLGCRLGCRRRHPLGPGPEPWELRFFGALLRRAACVRHCEEAELGAGSRHRVSQEVSGEFYRRSPYNYLQRAYFKLNQLDKAAEAAHTFFMANPEHMEIQENLENYKTMAESKGMRFTDREHRPHMEDYTAGIKYYDAEEYELAIEHLEEALKGYYQADVECRAMCEGPQRFTEYEYMDYNANLYEATADHYIQMLVCEHECVRDLATRPGRLSPIENYLPLHYDFLQFSYYKVNDYRSALQCAKSYLLFHPGDEDVTDNVSYYELLLPEHVSPEEIQPRKEAVEFMKRHKLESEMIQTASTDLGFMYTEPDFWTSYGLRQDENRVPSGVHSELTDAPGFTLGKKNTKKFDTELREGGPLLFDNVKFVYNSKQLNGTQRVLLDNVISEGECQELQRIAKSIMLAGDGYRGKTSPHTPNEQFEGATVLKALKYGYEGRVLLRSALLFYDVSEKARRIVESYFQLNSTLYFSYTHLVCRTAMHGQQENRNDLSHPIHADNCLLDPEANECWKEPPAYISRDYSALLYLNGDFEGGEFIFTEMDAKTVTATIKPECGRMISFSSGGENPHGVKAVTEGQRCAVALWFTLDPLNRELERLQADEVIAVMDGHSQSANKQNINPRDEL